MSAVVVGFAANAATVSWQATADWVSPDDDAALEGAKFYLFDATAYSIATFTADMGAGSDAFANALGNGVVSADGDVNFVGTGLTYANDGSKDLAKAYGVILADKDGTDFY